MPLLGRGGSAGGGLGPGREPKDSRWALDAFTKARIEHVPAPVRDVKRSDSGKPIMAPVSGPSLARDRLGALAVVAAVSLSFHVAVNWVLGQVTQLAFLAAAICLSTDAILIASRRNRDVRDSSYINLGWLMVVAHAVALAAYELTLVDAPVPQFMLLSLQALAVAAALPMTMRATVLVTVFTCALQPLGALVGVSLGWVTPPSAALGRTTLGAAVTCFLALGIYLLLQRYPVRRGRAAGSYVLRSRIGTGGMGEVWEAQHSALALPAAVKIISSYQDEASVARFQREARATALLTSIHTVRLYDYGIASDARPYYAMELLNGFDLQRVVEATGPLEPSRVVALMTQVCDSLAEAHAAGLFHRDIKPPNLFVTHLGRQLDVVKVLDFGLVSVQRQVREAGKLSSLTLPGGITGTPEYYPPELVEGGEPDARSDIYQVGCVMFFLLTGETVFPARGPVATLLLHATSSARRPSEVAGAKVPPDLDELVSRCLDKDPDRRPQSADELLASLQALECAGTWTQEKAQAWWDELAVFQEPNVETAARRLSPMQRIH